MKNCKSYEQIVMDLYPQIDATCERMLRKIFDLAVHSHNVQNATMAQIDTICLLIERKNNLAILKQKIDLVLSRLSADEMAIIEQKYINKRAIGGLNCSNRHYYRKLNKLHLHLQELFGYIGITEKYFFDNFGYLVDYDVKESPKQKVVKCDLRSLKKAS